MNYYIFFIFNFYINELYIKKRKNKKSSSIEGMKLILLRHEDRNLLNPLFFTPLTDLGMTRRYQLVEPLSMENIDVIYSSPFLRTLETIYPTAKFLKKKVNVEYGLYEYVHNPLFTFTDWYHRVDELWEEHPHLKKMVNERYRSVVTQDDFEIMEDEKRLERRLTPFLHQILREDSQKTVLLVTHGGVINKIKDMLIERTPMNDYFPMGNFEVFILP